MEQNRTYKLVISGFIILTTLACNAASTALEATQTPLPPTPPHAPTATSAPSISHQVTLMTVPFQEEHSGDAFPSYKITSQTPQLTGSDDPRVRALNQRLNQLVADEVDLFRQGFRQLPITPLSNGSWLEAEYTLVSRMGDLWSFKFDFLFYSDTAAHPGLNTISINYDLAQGRELTLGDLFLPNSNYLEVISNYCVAELSWQTYSDSFWLEGANPTPENYRNWNITPEGVVITFGEYQVAPYASGPQTVIVPYRELQAITNPDGPLAESIQ
jgi:hypothetical protein